MISPSPPPARPSLREALAVWLRIGLLGFGGPAGQIALMHRELVEKRRWLDERRFLHALNYCMLLPGPEAQQLATYSGWLLHGVRGGVLAGALFVLPGALLMWAIAWLYITQGDLAWLAACFHGLKSAVIALVAVAVLRIGGKALRRPLLWGLAALSFVAICFFQVPFPVVVLAALAAGLVFGRRHPEWFDGSPAVADDPHGRPAIQAPGWRLMLLRCGLWLALWLAPPLACLAWLGPAHLFTRLGAFLSQVALVTFGGAYAVLPYVAGHAVDTHQWLDAGQMMDGLALAETTPGPLILVLQFVGFLAGWQHPGPLAPLWAATLAAALTTWVTFMPGYLFIFAGAPWFESARRHPRLQAALAAVTAAVAGVILNLALWFAWHATMPEPGRVDPIPLLLGGLWFWLMTKRHWGMLPVVGAAAAIGLALHFAGLA